MPRILPGLLRYRVVKAGASGSVITEDLPHPHQSEWTILGSQPGNPSNAMVGAFKLPLWPPGTRQYRAAKSIYDQLDRWQRVEAYLSYKGAIIGGPPKFAGPITGIDRVSGEGALFELTGGTDLAWAERQAPFPGELLPNDVSSAQLKNYLGAKELGWTDTFVGYNGTGYASTSIPAHTAGTFSAATDPVDGLASVQCNTGTGAALLAQTGAAAGDRYHAQYVTVTGRITPTSDPNNGGTFGVGLSNSNANCQDCVVAWVVARSANGRYNLDVTLAVYIGNALNGSYTIPNALLDVDDVNGYIPVTIGLLAYDGGGFAGHSNAVVVNGKSWACPSNYDPGTATRYPFVLYGAPATGTAKTYHTNLVQMTKVATDGPSAAAMFIAGTITAATNSLRFGTPVGPHFLDVWQRLATREAWMLRYTPQAYKIGVRTLGQVDFSADPGTDYGSSRRVVYSRAARNLISLRQVTNADPFSTTLQASSSISSDGGGLGYWYDIANMIKYGVIDDQVLALTAGDFDVLRKYSQQIIANRVAIGPSGAKVARVLRTSGTVDVARELDKVMIHEPWQNMNQAVVRVLGYTFKEGADYQDLMIDQYAPDLYV